MVMRGLGESELLFVNPGSSRIKDKMRFDLMVSRHSDSGIKAMSVSGEGRDRGSTAAQTAASRA